MKKILTDAAIWKKVKKAFDPGAAGLDPQVWNDFYARVEKLIHPAVDEGGRKHITVDIDGAARNNPGPAGIGMVVRDQNGMTVKEFYEFIGEETNNVAEYRALLKALDLAAEFGADKVTIRTDSELLANQMNGRFRVKNIRLLNSFFSAQEKMKLFARVIIEQIPREQNRRADMLANLAIDAQQRAKESS